MDKRQRKGQSGLIDAATRGQVTAARQLIEAGADVNAANDNGDSPLTIAAAAGRTELAELILAAGADSNGRNRAGETALI
ncbi:ankyrin repeat domain-containing protein, partial [Acinetobacter baumannii]|uniref:ankyrin repeat domain-containing protein n=1 Tax=Acinetobacter baumannii TaxID=470 RepID=UPI0020195462